MTIAIIDTLLETLEREGAARYGSEEVSVLQHSLQCAALAAARGEPLALVSAALLHDYGHVMHDEEHAAARGRDMRHEVIAADYLSRWFGSEVTEPIRLHVPAKRYLCATEPSYYGTLSAGSVRSMKVQGGAFSPAESTAFRNSPHATEAVRLRRWDDEAKIGGLNVPGLQDYRSILIASLRRD